MIVSSPRLAIEMERGERRTTDVRQQSSDDLLFVILKMIRKGKERETERERETGREGRGGGEGGGEKRMRKK